MYGKITYFFQAFCCQIPEFLQNYNNTINSSCSCCPTGIVLMWWQKCLAVLMGNKTEWILAKMMKEHWHLYHWHIATLQVHLQVISSLLSWASMVTCVLFCFSCEHVSCKKVNMCLKPFSMQVKQSAYFTFLSAVWMLLLKLIFQVTFVPFFSFFHRGSAVFLLSPWSLSFHITKIFS